LQLSMLGSRERPTISAKAGESGTLVAFAYELATKHRAVLSDGSALVGAGAALMQYMQVSRSNPLRLSVEARQSIADALIRFVTLREAAGIVFKPKAHLVTHMIADLGRFGNPCNTGTWVDEGLNARLAAVCKSSNRAVWSQRVMAVFRHDSGPTANAARMASKKQRIRS
jgi:hypothetical protein